VSGVHPRVAMAILRHARIAMTLEVYTYVFEDQQQEAVDAIAALVQPKQ
jgi:hypothetical protein